MFKEIILMEVLLFVFLKQNTKAKITEIHSENYELKLDVLSLESLKARPYIFLK